MLLANGNGCENFGKNKKEKEKRRCSEQLNGWSLAKHLLRSTA
jgi:hypothetical protein